MKIEAEDRTDPVRDNYGGRRVRGRRAYAVAFRVGAMGMGTLTGLLLVLPTLAVLAAMLAWTIATLFLLPWLYICVIERDVRLPVWVHAFRGPHQ